MTSHGRQYDDRHQQFADSAHDPAARLDPALYEEVEADRTATSTAAVAVTIVAVAAASARPWAS
jgi:hypothetical protein